ncbi:MAG: hypothetical protein PCFJNLEI_04094 [Verrucomicrobiae bacterium]|nr:hypothetical protein [Verrucomicrobiae bacterium]
MRRLILILLLLCIPAAAYANPVMLPSSGLLAFCIVVFWALVVEAGVVTLLLMFKGLVPLRFFMAFGLSNFAVFAFLFCPLLSLEKIPLGILELLVVGVDGAFIKLIARADGMQGDDYVSLSWSYALVTSLAGNAVSYFVGATMSSPSAHQSWWL